MALLALRDAIRAWFVKYEVPATVVHGKRARVAQGNYKSGTVGGRVSLIWTGKAKDAGPTYGGPRAHEDTISDGGLIALVNDVREKRREHWATGAPVHLVATTPSIPEAAETLADALDLANALREAEQAHHEDLTAHAQVDDANDIAAPAASSRATLRTLALELQEKGNAHDRVTPAHGAEDEDHDSTQEDPLCTGARSHAVAQFVIEVDAEVWAWDDSAPTDDDAQFRAWLSLNEAFQNAVRKYQSRTAFDRAEPSPNASVHVVRGLAVHRFFWLPIPVHKLPAITPHDNDLELTAKAEFPQGTTADGTPIDPVIETILTDTLTP